MMREVLRRRFTRLQREDPEQQSGQWPDLLVIDGGPGQLSAALDTLGACGVTGLPVLAIAKGPDRDAGRETLHMPDRTPFKLDPRDPVLYFLQRLRDEAHRFAITSHRARRGKLVGRSALDRVPGVGAQAQARAARPLRLGAGDRDRGAARPGARAGHQQGGCQSRL